MKNASGKVIYVGKAINIRRRLASYFQSRHRDYKTRRLVPKIRDIEVILVNTENESLILENNLIKHYKPSYNRMLMRDDIGYPFIVLTGEKYPRLLPYRRNWHNKQWEQTGRKERGERFGPYLNKAFRDTVLSFAIERYGLRICSSLPQKVCLRYHLEKCSGICEKKISSGRYVGDVRKAVKLLSHRTTQVLEQMQCRMGEYAEKYAFEKAGKLRDQIQILSRVLEKQIVDRDVKHNQAVVFIKANRALTFGIYRGILRECHLYKLGKPAAGEHKIEHFLKLRYATSCPEEIIINQPHHYEKVESELSARYKRPINITVPKKGVEKELMMLCRKNFEYRTALNETGTEP